ncbi:2-acylglycerophosphoethanolamine acyltransferase [Legionella santicrucis]|uniref:2-acylglycerophosphoethanolamine acyltransferase n=1 Tax=Legionella santicrucis TaxID=45074 RepID=A0A0W0YRS7_9GAMM|nr:AMP-binding protein [Legionella santicrucis]KTD59573.1 2-acylglycerophosphoethanolamine acyltransferase [Legionella santicrucis]
MMSTICINSIPSSAAICFNFKQMIEADEMKQQVKQLQEALALTNLKCLGLYLDNSPEWLYVSLATMAAEISLVPLPLFFKLEQINYIISSTQMDGIISHDPQILSQLMPEGRLTKLANNLFIIQKEPSSSVFQGILTFTSGSTGAPKGVLLPYANVVKQLNAIYAHLQPENLIRYLSLMPFSILLENLIAIDTLLHGGVVYLQPVASFLDLNQFSIKVAPLLVYLQTSEIDTLLLMPLFLEQLMDSLENHQLTLPESIRFIALGSAMVSSSLLSRAAKLNLPIYQGYGLSESCSIVSMNTVQENKLGSVGKVLPHIDLKIDEQNSILIRGNLFQSYLGETAINPDEFFDTGDLGYLEDGFLYFTGRKKNLMVLSNGRNVSPEWIENELSVINSIKHLVVEGDSRPFISVIIDPKPNFDEALWLERLGAINQKLPAFAQVKAYLIAREPFTRENHLLTLKHRPDTRAIRRVYQKELEAVYDELSEAF